jgi:TatD DNase family protein
MTFETQLPENTWIDAHCHLTDPRFSTDLDDVIARSCAAGVQAWVQGGVSPDDWSRQIQLRKQYGKAVIMSFGLHPLWVAQQSRAEIEMALSLLEGQISAAAALGELGLDFRRKDDSAETRLLQQYAFERQLEIAKNAAKPLILHVVHAHAEAIRCLKKWSPFPHGGMVHLFSGSLETARIYLKMGFYISVGGSITRKGFQKLKRAIHSLPRDRILLETDAPDQMPLLPAMPLNPLNEPAQLVQIAGVLANMLQVDRDELLFRSTSHLKKLFGIDV